ncbi:MAG: antitoxin family protein [Verrucomicrobiales bacterium]
MTLAIRAIYEEGILRPLEQLDLEERTIVRLSVETEVDDLERQQWLNQGERTLMGVWDNEADDVYNVLLTE